MILRSSPPLKLNWPKTSGARRKLRQSRTSQGKSRSRTVSHIFSNFLRSLRGPSGTDMLLLCRQLLSQRGEASQTALAQKIIVQYCTMDPAQQLSFFEMLAREFNPDQGAIQKAMEEYQQSASPTTAAALSSAAESPRQELFRRINTATAGTENLVSMRRDLLRILPGHPQLAVVDSEDRKST